MIQRVEQLLAGMPRAARTLVQIEDAAVLRTLLHETARLAADAPQGAVMIVVDAVTADGEEALNRARGVADQMFCLGPNPPASWPNSLNVICVTPPPEVMGGMDRFLAVVAPTVSVAIVAWTTDESAEASVRQGGWTTHPEAVKAVAAGLLDWAACIATLRLPPASSEAQGQGMAAALHLMAQVSQQFARRQRHMAQDKNDLFSVLNILKAISAKRRAHDILYEFVEQVARVVQMERCSVVRVWGGETEGHVLASHDNASIRDLKIDLSKYPELCHALEHREKVVINDVFNDPLTREFASELRHSQAIAITSLIVIPVVLFDQNVGSLFLRAARGKGPFDVREVNFCEIVAETAANALERAYLFESIQRANERLEHLAITDGLTGLYNHRYFRERLEEEFERARRYDLPLSCLILDVDDFKGLNDTFGHLLGDSVLREIALRTTHKVRKSDTVARYGGEEFVVIMPQTGRKGAEAEGNRIRREIAARPFEGLPDDVRVTVSAGVSVFDKETMLDCEALIRSADGALYEAKRSGKNRVVMGE